MAFQDTDPRLFGSRGRGHWLRLRTLILLRWIAIAGQIAAIVVAVRVFGVELELGPCYLAIGMAIVANLVAIFLYPGTHRLSEDEAMLTQLFDIVQLSFLLFLTGGLSNPFALLIVAPVTVSATALRARSTVFLGTAAALLMTLLAFRHLPLTLADGSVLELPGIWRFGVWTAILIAMAFLAAYAHRITGETQSMSDALAATQMALAREQKLTDLGGVVAAAAHELGTPLATIKLVSAELMEELADRPDLRADAELIRSQADRCAGILRSMGRAGKDDVMMRSAPLGAVLREAAEPHANRGKRVVFEIGPGPAGEPREPQIFRRPEVIHGLRNLVQNAVDFAAATVWVSADWRPDRIRVRIVDDGAGFPPDLFGRIGEPFVRSREAPPEPPRPAPPDASPRPGYEGMGLGLFIAKTLLERSGAELIFANGSDPFLSGVERPERGGAVVELVWPRAALAVGDGRQGPLGPNRPITA